VSLGTASVSPNQTMLKLLSSMAMTIAAADDSSSMLQHEATKGKKADIKLDMKANFSSSSSDCLTRTNFHRTKWGLAPMAENPSCFACIGDASCSNNQHGAHSSRKYGITCPMRAQNEGHGSTCASVVDAWYNERYSCSTSAGTGTHYKVAHGVVGKRACMSACNDDPKCKSFDYTTDKFQTDTCRFFETGQTPEAPATCSESAFEVGIGYKNGAQLGVQSASSAKDCCAKCSAFKNGEQRCKYFTFLGSSNQCWLKYDNAGRRSEATSSKAVSGGPRMVEADSNPRQYCSGGTSGHGGSNGGCTGHCGAVMSGPELRGGLVMSCAGCEGRWTCNYGLSGRVCDTSCSTGKWNDGKCVGGSVDGPSPPAPSPPTPSPKPDCSALKTAFKKAKKAKTEDKTAFKNAKKAWKKCTKR